MGIYIFALKAPSTAVRAVSKSSADPVVIGRMAFWYKPSFQDEREPHMQKQTRQHNLTVGAKEHAWKSSGLTLTGVVNDDELNKLLAGEVSSIPVMKAPDGVWAYDDNFVTIGKLYRTELGPLDYESFA